LAATGLSLNQVKASVGKSRCLAAPRDRKYSAPTENGAPRGFNTPDKKVDLYSHSFAHRVADPISGSLPHRVLSLPRGVTENALFFLKLSD
jgi:hypothetical protein